MSKEKKKIELGKYGIPQETENRIRLGIKAENKIDESKRTYKFRWPIQYRKDKIDACLALQAMIRDGWDIQAFIPDGRYFILERLDL